MPIWRVQWGREEQLLSASIIDSLGKARTAQWKLSDILDGPAPKSAEDPGNDARDETEETLAYNIERLFRDIAILAERLCPHDSFWPIAFICRRPA